MIYSITRGITDILYPRHCLGCGHHDPSLAEDPLCPSCRERIPFNHPPFCHACGRHLDAPCETGLCRACASCPPTFDSAWVITRYTPPMPALIGAFKFRDKTALRKTFDHLTERFFSRYKITPAADMVLPIPVHAVRFRERGYDQSALLATAFAVRYNIPLHINILERVSYRPRQSDLGRKERWTNVKGAFRIRTPLSVKNKKIYIVDDLLTTGATATEAAQALKNAGAARVELIALSAA